MDLNELANAYVGEKTAAEEAFARKDEISVLLKELMQTQEIKSVVLENATVLLPQVFHYFLIHISMNDILFICFIM
ncbi:MAG: hypothetical protein LBF12_07080 [Christensenellaceae bacterium]|jgi:hypothetical protein|nr:hypothetical protein [Christensenellaceae bacterium]